MEEENRLDLNFVSEKLLDMFKEQATLKGINPDNFKSRLIGKQGEIYYENDNSDIKVCYSFFAPKFENGYYYLRGGLISKCVDNILGSGTLNIDSIIRFGQTYGYDYWRDIDASVLTYQFVSDGNVEEVEISLFEFYILAYGRPWYAMKYGFIYPGLSSFLPAINGITKTKITTILQRQTVQNQLEFIGYLNSLSEQLDDSFTHFKGIWPRTFNVTRNADKMEGLQILQKYSIKDIFAALNNDLRVACPSLSCPPTLHRGVRTINDFITYIITLIFEIVKIPSNKLTDMYKIFNTDDVTEDQLIINHMNGGGKKKKRKSRKNKRKSRVKTRAKKTRAYKKK